MYSIKSGRNSCRKLGYLKKRYEKQDMEINPDRESQHNTQYMVNKMVEENKYIVKCVNYILTYFIKICEFPTK